MQQEGETEVPRPEFRIPFLQQSKKNFQFGWKKKSAYTFRFLDLGYYVLEGTMNNNVFHYFIIEISLT